MPRHEASLKLSTVILLSGSQAISTRHSSDVSFVDMTKTKKPENFSGFLFGNPKLLIVYLRYKFKGDTVRLFLSPYSS